MPGNRRHAVAVFKGLSYGGVAQNFAAAHPQRHRMAWLGTDPYMAGRRDGQTDIGALAAGQSSALIHEVKPAGDIVRDIMAEATRALERLSGKAAMAR
ncbi:MAG: hypothetical protein ACSLFL_09660 [Alphaproteobacteria bacterium]